MKVHLWPSFKGEDKGDGGIRRVVEGQIASFPAAGIEVVPVTEADVIGVHAVLPDEYFLPKHARTPLVAHCHGLYWSEFEWENWALKANADVMEAIRVADIVTAPSEWVARAIRRHTMRDVRVVPHGVDLDDWQPWSESSGCQCPPDEREPIPGIKVRVHMTGCPDTLPKGGYVLWNKTRPDPVCDPETVNVLAARMPDVQFRTTFGNGADNVEVTGRLPFEQAKIDVRRAGVYLATTRETFGVGTLEALAAGVPVVGWRWGGQAEFIEHGVDGWLARPGDYADLEAGIRWAQDRRHEIVAACRAKAKMFPWDRAAEMYRDVYRDAMAKRTYSMPHFSGPRPRPRVSIVVTAYKLAQYLPDALDSVLAQTYDDWECIIVDDASPDDCGKIADAYAKADSRFRVIHNERNLYLSGARNAAIAASHGEYILPLDADDRLTPEAVQILADALDADKRIHVAYGNVQFVDVDGKPVTYSRYEHDPGHSGWPVDYRFDWLMKGPGQLGPYSSMFRREVLELTVGYRRRYRSGEDQDVWLRAASYGFRPAMVTEAETLVYRVRSDSMSSGGHLNHRGWYPWSKDPRLTPAGAANDEQLPIHSCDPPLVSVIIPVGPGHEELLIDAVDSVDAQFYRRWECIVVNDTGKPLPALPSWVRTVCSCGALGLHYHDEKAIPRGVAAARNAGIAASLGTYFLPLDADDMLEPRCIAVMMQAEKQSGGRIVYSDFWEDPDKAGQFRIYEAADWDPAKLVSKGAIAAVTQLTPKAVWEAVGGYDERVAWEDWAFQIAYAERGYCATHVPQPLWTYRKHTGKRRDENVTEFEASKQSIIDKFEGRYWDVDGVPGKEELMACRSCGGGGGRTEALAQSFERLGAAPEGAVMIEYGGNIGGERRFRGPSGAVYPFDKGVRRFVLAADVETFTKRPDFRVVDQTIDAPAETPTAPTLTADGPPEPEEPAKVGPTSRVRRKVAPAE